MPSEADDAHILLLESENDVLCSIFNLLKEKAMCTVFLIDTVVKASQSAL